MAPAHWPPVTACPAALQDRSMRTKRAILEQPGLINHPAVQGFGIKISPEPHKVSGCLPCKAALEGRKWDGQYCKGGLTCGLNVRRQQAAAAACCTRCTDACAVMARLQVTRCGVLCSLLGPEVAVRSSCGELCRPAGPRGRLPAACHTRLSCLAGYHCQPHQLQAVRVKSIDCRCSKLYPRWQPRPAHCW